VATEAVMEAVAAVALAADQRLANP
jgi:hypothetical protein